ncbi:hypothetical protein D9M68_891020 [compost metagenome]
MPLFNYRQLGFTDANRLSHGDGVIGDTIVVDIHNNRFLSRGISERRAYDLLGSDIGSCQRLFTSLHVSDRLEAGAAHGERTTNEQRKHQQHDQTDHQGRPLLIKPRNTHGHGVSLRPETLTSRTVVE